MVSSLPSLRKLRRLKKVRAPPPALGWPPWEGPRRPRPGSSFLTASLLVWADDTGTPITKIELVPSHSTATLIEEPTEVEDPWDLPELKDTGLKWSGK